MSAMMIDEPHMPPARPLLRYHGGKFRMAPWIVQFFPPHACYVEPFGGAASILLHKPRVAAECYNDLDKNVVNLFRALRDPVKAAELHRRCALTPYAREEFEFSYEPAVDDIDAAHKLIIRSFMGHGSDSATRSCRTGFRSKLTDERGLPASEFAEWHHCIPVFVERLRGVLIENRNAIEVIGRMDSPRTLIYADPPYVHSTRSSLKGRSKKTHGYAHEMTDADHEALATCLHGVAGMVVLSGYPSGLYADLYKDWKQFSKRCMADMGRERTEVLWINPAAQQALAALTSQQSLFEAA